MLLDDRYTKAEIIEAATKINGRLKEQYLENIGLRARVAQLEDHNKGLGDALAGYVERVAELENANFGFRAAVRACEARVAELEAGMLDLANRVMPKMRAQVADLEAENERLRAKLRVA